MKFDHARAEATLGVVRADRDELGSLAGGVGDLRDQEKKSLQAEAAAEEVMLKNFYCFSFYGASTGYTSILSSRSLRAVGDISTVSDAF